MSGECNSLSLVSSQQRFEATDVKALSMSQLLDSLCYSSWIDQFYLDNKGKYILKTWGYADPKDVKRRETERETERMSTCTCGRERQKQRQRQRETESTWMEEIQTHSPLAPLFICFFFFFFLPLGLPLYGLARSDACSTRGPHSGPQIFLCSIFLDISLLAATILDSFFVL